MRHFIWSRHEGSQSLETDRYVRYYSVVRGGGGGMGGWEVKTGVRVKTRIRVSEDGAGVGYN